MERFYSTAGGVGTKGRCRLSVEALCKLAVLQTNLRFQNTKQSVPADKKQKGSSNPALAVVDVDESESEPDLDDGEFEVVVLADEEAHQTENNDDGQEIDDVHIDLGSVDFN